MSAGPSKPSEPRRSRRSGDSSTKRKKRKSAVDVDDTPQSSAAPAVSFGEDFIGFAASEEDEPTKEQPKSTREWDVGKPSASTSEKSGRENDRRRGRESERDRDRDYGREDGYASKKQRVDAASRRALWVENIEWEDCMNIAEMLHKEVSAFVDYIAPSPVEHEVRGMIISIIENVIVEKYPDAKVLPFGSFETQLYLPLGDIDLVVQSDSMAYSDKVNVLNSLANTLRKAGVTERVSIIGKAKVPIIKFVTTHGHFAVDISINQMNGVSAGQMVNNYIRALPALRAVVLVVKSFLSQRSMNEVFTGGLGSYSVVCLAVSFLQQHPKIRRGEMDPTKNLGVLVMEFFEFYGIHYNYTDVGISLRDGGTYYNKFRRGWADYKQPGLLSIEDPADPSNDISRGSYGIARVRQTLAGAYEIMMASAYQRAESIRARRSGRFVSLRNNQTTQEEWSILASVMGITQETINHRRVVQEVYDKGVLHRMLGLERPGDAVSHPKQAAVAGVWETNESDSAKSDGEIASRSQSRSRSRSPSPKPQSKKRQRTKTENSRDEEEEESRYGIVKDIAGLPTKRRRTGGEVDSHTVFTTDEDGEYDIDSDSSKESSDDRRRKGGRSAKGGSSKEKRSYWLSKGVGPLEEDSE